MAHAERITFAEYRSRFATEADCREYLFQIRFPEGFVCPKCGCTEYYPIRTRHICQCKNCRKQTSVTAGTVMHRTHLPLTVWFWAIYLCATDKRGISAVALSGQLCISYERLVSAEADSFSHGRSRSKLSAFGFGRNG